MQTDGIQTDAADHEALRVAVYRAFAADGVVGSAADLAARVGQTEAVTREGLRVLAGQRHLVLGPGNRVLMAHPFAAVPLGFSVMGRQTLWWGGCAWDSFPLPHLLRDEPDVLVATRCPGCDRARAWVVSDREPPPGEQVAHFPVPVTQMWDDVLSTCAGQRLFCSADCVTAWTQATGQPRGCVMDLATLWRLASGWYEGRLEYGYQRRDPATAAAYFREVGLRGSFWGL